MPPASHGPDARLAPAGGEGQALPGPAAGAGPEHQAPASAAADPPPWCLAAVARSLALRDWEAMRGVNRSWRATMSSEALWGLFSLARTATPRRPSARSDLERSLLLHGPLIRSLDLSLRARHPGEGAAPPCREGGCDGEEQRSIRPAEAGFLRRPPREFIFAEDAEASAAVAACPNLRSLDLAGSCRRPPRLAAVLRWVPPAGSRPGFRLRKDLRLPDIDLLRRGEADGLAAAHSLCSDERVEIAELEAEFWEERTRLQARARERCRGRSPVRAGSQSLGRLSASLAFIRRSTRWPALGRSSPRPGRWIGCRYRGLRRGR